jgi:hypothetical protein
MSTGCAIERMELEWPPERLITPPRGVRCRQAALAEWERIAGPLVRCGTVTLWNRPPLISYVQFFALKREEEAQLGRPRLSRQRRRAVAWVVVEARRKMVRCVEELGLACDQASTLVLPLRLVRDTPTDDDRA